MIPSYVFVLVLATATGKTWFVKAKADQLTAMLPPGEMPPMSPIAVAARGCRRCTIGIACGKRSEDAPVRLREWRRM
jgi:hypothetical protein